MDAFWIHFGTTGVRTFEVRGADVNSLPADGTKVKATLHEKDGGCWVTDVQKME